MSDSLSMAFLVLLESLSPTERAVFLLHEVFAYDYREIAEITGKSEPNCRQIFVRARQHVDQGKPRFEASREHRDEVARRFFEAAGGGDLNGLLELLAPDVVMIGDGGGKGRARREPTYGPDRVSRFIVGLFRRAQKEGTYGVPALVNGQPGAVVYDSEGRVASVFALDIADGQVQAIRSVVNPDKLQHLGAVSDILRLPSRDQND
jgi:RNA polymerase sigma-70 factor (ECF subfamily)